MEQNTSIPKYQIIIDDILDRIARNDFTYDAPICTEQSLMDEYNVSRITVTRALTELLQRGVIYRKRGLGSFVSKAVPVNSTSEVTAAVDPKTVSFLVPFDLTTPIVSGVVKIVSDGLSKHGYFVNVYVCNASSSQEKANLKLLLSQNPSAVIYLPFRDKIYINQLNALVMQNKPVIVIDKYTDCPYIHNITSDNFEGGRLLTEHLLSLGHQNIAFLTTAPVDEVSSVRNRFGGFLYAMRHSGLSTSPNNLVYLPCDLGNEAPEEFPNPQIVSFIKKCRQKGITGILTENDLVADYVYRVCQHLGIKVPEDNFSICGFDDNEFSRKIPGGITTIKQDYNETAQEVLSILTNALSDSAAPVVHRSIPVSLIVRGSTGPATR